MWELILCMRARLILQCLFLLVWKIFQPMAMLSLVLCALCNVKCIQQRCSFLQILLFYLNLATYLTLTSQHHFDLVYYLKMLSMITAIPLLPFFLSFTILGLHSRDFRYNLPFSSAMLGFQNQDGGQCVDHVVTNS